MNKINVWIILICRDCLPICDTKLRDHFFLSRCVRTFCAQNCSSQSALCANIKIYLFIAKIVSARWAYAELISNLFSHWQRHKCLAWHGVAVVCLLGVIFVVVAVVSGVAVGVVTNVVCSTQRNAVEIKWFMLLFMLKPILATVTAFFSLRFFCLFVPFFVYFFQTKNRYRFRSHSQQILHMVRYD